MTTDPLATLLDHLEHEGTVPLAWVVAHAPDGDLSRVWTACDHPAVILALASASLPRVAVVRALCALAESVVPDDRADTAARDAIAVAAAWCRGEADTAAAERAADRAFDASDPLADVPATVARRACQAVFADARGAHSALTLAMVAALAAQEAVGCFSAGARRDDPRRAAASAALARVARTHLPCPTLAQLRDAYAR